MRQLLFFLLLLLCAICSNAQKFIVSKDSINVTVSLMDRMEPYKLLNPGDTFKVNVPRDQLFFFPIAAEVDLNDTYELVMFLKNKKVNVPIVETVDANAFTGLWKKDLANGFSYSGTTNQTLTYSFIGKAFKLIALKDPTYGILSVQINNQTPLLIDLYASSHIKNVTILDTAQQGIALSFGTNTVTLKVTGQKNAASSNTYCVLDYAVITK